MYYNKTQIIFTLFTILTVLYAVNIFLTKSISDILVATPVKVSFVIIEPPKDRCENCFDADNVAKMIKTAHNIKYTSSRMLYTSRLSQKYIETYGIRNLPAVVVSGDIANKNLMSAWKALSGEKRNGRIVIDNLLPHYNIESDKVKGVISAVLIKDKTCKKCFDENKYINILGKFGMVVGNTEVYDVASNKGRAFVRKYFITKIPTLILSPDAGDYPGFAASWADVGTIEKDGWFIFRKVQKLSKEYKNI